MHGGTAESEARTERQDGGDEFSDLHDLACLQEVLEKFKRFATDVSYRIAA